MKPLSLKKYSFLNLNIQIIHGYVPILILDVVMSTMLNEPNIVEVTHLYRVSESLKYQFDAYL